MTDEENLADMYNRHKEAFEMKSAVSEALNGHSFSDIMATLIMVYTEVLMNCAPSLEVAEDMAADFAARSITALKAFSDEGLCSWNTSGTLQ